MLRRTQDTTTTPNPFTHPCSTQLKLKPLRSTPPASFEVLEEAAHNARSQNREQKKQDGRRGRVSRGCWLFYESCRHCVFGAIAIYTRDTDLRRGGQRGVGVVQIDSVTL